MLIRNPKYQRIYFFVKEHEKIAATLLFLLFTAAGNLLSFFLPMDDGAFLSFLGVLSFLEFVLFLVLNARMTKTLFNYASVFLSVLFLFNFGQLMIYTFFRPIYSHVRFLVLMPAADAAYGFRFMHAAFMAVCLGALIGAGCVKGGVEKAVSEKLTLIRENGERFAQSILLLTFPVKIAIDIACVVISFADGGQAARTWLNEFPNVLVYYAKASLVGFALWIVATREQPKKQLGIFVFIECYILLMMVSGIRSENVGYLLVLLFVFMVNRKKKIRILTVLLSAVILLFVMVFIITVGEFRIVEEKNIQSFAEMFRYYLTEKNIVLYFFDICGDTGYTAQCVLNKWLPEHAPSYGNAYYLGILAVIPNIPGVFTFPGDMTEASYFALKLQQNDALYAGYKNIGGSLLGESFFNFGLLGGCLFAILIGVLAGIISKKMMQGFAEKNYIKLSMVLPASFAMIYWVRDYFGGGIREVVWSPILCCLIPLFILKRFVFPKTPKSKRETK